MCKHSIILSDPWITRGYRQKTFWHMKFVFCLALSSPSLQASPQPFASLRYDALLAFPRDWPCTSPERLSNFTLILILVLHPYPLQYYHSIVQFILDSSPRGILSEVTQCLATKAARRRKKGFGLTNLMKMKYDYTAAQGGISSPLHGLCGKHIQRKRTFIITIAQRCP